MKLLKLHATHGLMTVLELVKQTFKESYEETLKQWYMDWEKFINSRTFNKIVGKSFYTHKRIISAYKSLNINPP